MPTITVKNAPNTSPMNPLPFPKGFPKATDGVTETYRNDVRGVGA